VGRLLVRMRATGADQVVAQWPDALPDRPFLDLTSGYVQRSIDRFPRQGDRAPWRVHQNYLRDIAMLKLGPLEDEALEFSAGAPETAPAEPLAA
jgi:hypothetical protein